MGYTGILPLLDECERRSKSLNSIYVKVQSDRAIPYRQKAVSTTKYADFSMSCSLKRSLYTAQKLSNFYFFRDS